ncbi:MAG: hypothetical protein ACQSGP_05820 [Frankia sp.]
MREKTTGGSSPGLVLNSLAAEARTEILAVLGSWSGLVAAERRFHAPVRQVVALAEFLLTNLAWLASHPAAGDLSEEVARAVKIARRAAYPDSASRIVIGPCVVPACDGELTATVRARRSGEETRVRCAADPGHTWGGHEWTRLRRETGRTGPAAEERWLAAADIGRFWRTPTGTVYRLASEQGWRRITRAGRTYYAENDVHSSFSRREARAARKE